MKLTEKIVKKKKLQSISKNFAILIPKSWIEELDWNKKTELILEFVPYRKTIIISAPQKPLEDVKQGNLQPPDFIEKEEETHEEDSDIISI